MVITSTAVAVWRRLRMLLTNLVQVRNPNRLWTNLRQLIRKKMRRKKRR